MLPGSSGVSYDVAATAAISHARLSVREMAVDALNLGRSSYACLYCAALCARARLQIRNADAARALVADRYEGADMRVGPQRKRSAFPFCPVPLWRRAVRYMLSVRQSG